MLFEVSGVEVSLWIPPLVAFLIAFFGSMGGVSGAFLLLPFQMSVLGFTTPSVSATNLVYNMIGSPSGVYRYIREGRMFWQLGFVILLGQIPGLLIGIYLRLNYLPDPAVFMIFVASVLLYLAWNLARSALKKDSPQLGHEKEPGWGRVEESHFDIKQVRCRFEGKEYSFRTLPLMGFCSLVGVVSGCYGLGGAAILSPFFIAVCGLPVYIVAGPSLLANFLASTLAVLIYQFVAPVLGHPAARPDWMLGSLFGLGGVLGMYLGARQQRYVPARWIKSMLAAAALFVACTYLFEVLF